MKRSERKTLDWSISPSQGYEVKSLEICSKLPSSLENTCFTCQETLTGMLSCRVQKRAPGTANLNLAGSKEDMVPYNRHDLGGRLPQSLGKQTPEGFLQSGNANLKPLQGSSNRFLNSFPSKFRLISLHISAQIAAAAGLRLSVPAGLIRQTTTYTHSKLPKCTFPGLQDCLKVKHAHLQILLDYGNLQGLPASSNDLSDLDKGERHQTRNVLQRDAHQSLI